MSKKKTVQASTVEAVVQPKSSGYQEQLRLQFDNSSGPRSTLTSYKSILMSTGQ